ncbi:galactose mutarotase-like protein [Daedaleopsis nitida]|nr:galactose mutarotase-like protein [Daedaleopsis nitida]
MVSKFLTLLLAGALAQGALATADLDFDFGDLLHPTGWPFDESTIKAPDGSVTAKFVSIGATLTELWVNGRDGKQRDIVLGYDDNSKLLTDPAHPYFNPIVGRYANRIKNGRFSIPISKDPQPGAPNVYQIPQNEGNNTLHGGILGWDRRNWTMISKTSTSVTYFHLDTADEGFPGTVAAFVTHTVSNGGQYKVSILAKASQKTPIMLTQHIYWNLDGFQGADTIFDYNLELEASRVVAVDGTLIPTGEFTNVSDTALDFRTAQKIGSRWNDTVGLCGADCQGYDNCWVYDRDVSKDSGFAMWSDLSGIKVEMWTTDKAVQFYSGNGIPAIPRKKAHGGPDLVYGKHSAMVIEQQGYIDAINNPEWNQDQIYGPGRDFQWQTTYKFSTV